MSKSTPFKQFALCALTTGLFVAGQNAFAHDSITPQALEGTMKDMNLHIVHGCETDTQDNPIIAQSVVFPTVNPELSAVDSSFNSVPAPADLSEVIDQGSFEALVDLIQGRSSFLQQAEKKNALGNMIGFYGKRGLLPADYVLEGRVAFQFTAPNFVPGSCVSHINVQVAIADICSTRKPTIEPGKVSLFIPDNGSQYAIKAHASGAEHGVGEPTVLQINRDLVNNPLDPSCPGSGPVLPEGGILLTVTPSAADIDANLGIPGYWNAEGYKQSEGDEEH